MENCSTMKPDNQETDSISGLRKKVKNIESSSGHSTQTLQLRDEIRRLEALLTYSNVRTNPTYANLFQDKSGK